MWLAGEGPPLRRNLARRDLELSMKARFVLASALLGALAAALAAGCAQPTSESARCSPSGDSAAVFVRFRDRSTTTDTVTALDRQAVAKAGGRIVFVYTIVSAVYVHLPRANVGTLAAHAAVLSVEDASDCIYLAGA